MSLISSPYWLCCFSVLIFLGACKKEPRVVEAFLPAGTEVTLVLLKELSSGGSKEGETFPLLVVENVMDAAGNVVIAKGTVAHGKVTWSRGSTVFTALVNQPARLAITLERTFDITGGTVPLTAKPGEQKAVLELTRASVSEERANAVIDRLLTSQDTADLLKQFSESFRDGNLSEETAEEFFEKIVDRLNMPNTRRLVEKQGAKGFRTFFNELHRGNVKRITEIDALLVISALSEMSEMAMDVQSRLRGIFKGANIKVPVGTPFTAYLSAPVRILIHEKGN